MPSYKRYSHHAQRAISHAEVLVRRYYHPCVNTGHLLVGVMLTEGSAGHLILNEMNLHVDDAWLHLDAMTDEVGELSDYTEYDDALNTALDLAEDESSWLGHHYVGTEHFLLGVTRTNVGNAATLLKKMGVAAEEVRHQVRTALSDGLKEYSLEHVRRNVRLSELSRRVINATEQLSIKLDHPTIGLGHLLLTLMRERRSVTSKILHQTPLDETRIENALERQDLLATVSIDSVVMAAVDHARQQESHYVGTEHLLLAFLDNDDGIALLRRFNLSPDVLHRIIKAYIDK